MEYQITIMSDVGESFPLSSVFTVDKSGLNRIKKLFRVIEYSGSWSYVWRVQEFDITPMVKRYPEIPKKDLEYLHSIIPTTLEGNVFSVSSVTATKLVDITKIL